ncbi:hypothetical protein KY335_03250 [Candidatus Woesearchaeota archaeon]|nr:hypothetical protein [Candidatus Woesearchaeota archaeon]
MKFKREYELAIFATIIVISIIFSLYYAGFTGELPTGALFGDPDFDGISAQVATACAALACPLCAPPYPPGVDTDGNGIPDNGCAAGSCQVAAGIGCPEIPPGDNDADFAPTQIEVDAYASFLIATNPGATYVNCGLTGATATTWDYNCFSSDGFSYDPISLAAVFSGSAICSAAPTGPTTFQVACACPAGLLSPLPFSWNVPIGDSPVPGLLDNRIGPPGVGYAVSSDDPTTYGTALSGSGTCPATATPEPEVIYTGGGGGCPQPELMTPEVMKITRGTDTVEAIVAVRHIEIFRNAGENARVSVTYP